jgi:hypothetical protein
MRFIELSDQTLETVAYDISEALAKGEWPEIDVCPADILPFLPEFLTKITSYSAAVERLGGRDK